MRNVSLKLKGPIKLMLLLIAFLQAGCATIISGRHQDVPVISSPHGAKACTSGQCVTTPGSFILRRDTNHIVVIEKDGYIPETATLTSGLGGAVAGNLLLGGIIGGGIDLASGAAYKLYPETVNVALREGCPSVLKQQIKMEQDAPKVIATLLPLQSTPKKTETVKHYATLTHTKGPMLTSPPQTMRAEYMNSNEEGLGVARVFYPGNYSFDGEYRTLASAQSFKSQVNPGFIDSDQTIDLPNASLKGFAVFTGLDGTVLECVYAMTGPSGNGLGSCADNRGNQYQLSF